MPIISCDAAYWLFSRLVSIESRHSESWVKFRRYAASSLNWYLLLSLCWLIAAALKAAAKQIAKEHSRTMFRLFIKSIPFAKILYASIRIVPQK